MNYPATERVIVLEPPSWRTELVIVGITLALAAGILVTPLALPLAVSGVVFVLAALRVTPFLNWDFPIRDLSTLVRFSFFAGVVVYRVSHDSNKDMRTWLFGTWLTR